jgi:gliding motility-associated-like protein
MRFLRSIFLCFSLLTALYGFSQSATFTTIPAAVNGTINVCAGSTILFNSTVNPNTLFAPAIYSWNFGNGQTSSIPGPVGITYATAGTYTATLNISSAGVPLTQTTVTINVSAAPAVVPTFSTVGNANNCEQLYTVNGVPMIQTTGNNCSCNQFTGPMISLNNANLLPAGSSATILWGGNGIGGASTTFPVGTSNLLAQPFNFPGQQNNNAPASHYNTPGSYNLMYLVTFPNGCTYSTYVIMSYGAGAISLGTLSAQTQCNPLNYVLTFANQTPGNTYVINWGDGTPNTTYTYPNLPLVPNGVPHQYSPSACLNGVPQPYTITVTATNPCPGSTTTSTIGPFNVNALPLAAFTSVPGNSICQNQSITFTNTSNGGLSINNGQCSNVYNFGWQIDYSSSLSGPGYQITSGTTGDAFNVPPVNGSGVITVLFTQPGTYSVSLDAINSACGNDNETQTITVNPIPIVPNQTDTICSGQNFIIVPQNNPPTTIVPNGTTYSWVATPNANVAGEVNGNNDTISGTLVNLTNVNQTVTYTVTPTVNGCQGAPFTVTVTVIPAIVVPNFTQTICNGGTFTINPTNAPPNTIIPAGTTFAWTVVDNPNVTGESNGTGLPLSQTLSTNVASPAQSVVYTVVATSPGGGCPNTTFTVTVNINLVTPPAISNDTTICSGGDPSAFVNTTAATASGTLTYQWQSATAAIGPFTNIAGATSATYNPPAGITVTTYYRVIVTSTLNGVACTATSNTRIVTVNNVSAGVLATSQTICSGGDPNAFTVTTVASGSGSLSYQWQSATAIGGPWTNLVGETNPTYDPPPGQTVTTYFRLVVTSTLNGIVCTATSAVMTVTVNNVTPSVVAGNQTVCSGGNPAAFTVTTAATGTGTLSYQWQSSASALGPWTNIGGATSATYDPPAGLVTTTYYQVVISSALNGVTCTTISNGLTVNVNSVTAQTIAAGQTICSGGDAVAFTVTTASTGAGNLSYQWQSASIAAGPFSNLVGATSSTYDPPAGQIASTYFQVVTSSVLNGVTCTSTSNVLAVLVNAVNSGTLGTSQTVCSGGNPSAFTASTAPSGAGTLTYQWQSSTVGPNSGFAPIPGATTVSYDPPAGISTTTYYQLVVTSTLNGVPCTATSATLSVTVNSLSAPVVGSNETICSGGNPVAFTNPTPAIGAGNVTYQWQSSTTNVGAGYSNIAGATSATYDPPAGLNVTTYYQVITTSTLNGVACNVTSNPITVSVNTVSAGTLAQSQTICSGGNPAAFTVTNASSGSGTLSFQWQSSTTGPNAGYTNIPGETNATYDPPAGLSITTYYQLVVTSLLNGVSCTATGNTLTVTVNSLTPSVIGSNETICPGGNPIAFTNSTAASGNGAVTYQWQSSTTNPASGFSNINLATSATYDPPAGLNTTTFYQVLITNTLNGLACQATSNVITVTVNTITPQVIAANQTICPNGDPVPFTVTTPSSFGGTASYQWYVSTSSPNNGFSPINGETTSAYDVPPGLAITSYYQVISTSTLNGITCSATSNTLTVTVSSAPVVQNVNQTICSGTAFTVSPVNGGGNSIPAGTSYTWTVNNNPNVSGQSAQNSGQNSISQTLTNNTNTPQTIIYSVTPTAGVCSGNPFSVNVLVNPTPVLTLSANQTICGGQTTIASTYTNSVAGGIFTYALQNAAGVPAVVTGFPTTGNGQIPAATINNSGTTPFTLNYTVTPAANGCNGVVGTYSITINPAPVTTFSIANQAICSGTNSAPVTFASTTPNVTYAWQATVPNGISNLAPTSGGGNLPSFANVTNANNAVQTVQFSVIASTAGTVCPGPPATYTIAVIPIPVANPLNNATYCNGVAIPALPITSNVPAATYAWSMSTNVGLTPTSGTGTPIPGFNASIAGNAPLTSTVTVTPSASSGATTCPGSPVSYTLTINPVPVVLPIANQVLCAGNTNNGVVIGSNVAGAAFAWTNNNTNIGLGASGSNTVPSFVGANNTNLPIQSTVSIVPSFTNNQVVCTGATSNYTITVNPLPTVASTQNQQVCAGTQVAVTFSSPNNIAGTVYNWTNSNAAIGLNGTGSGNISFTGVNNTNGPISGLIVVTPSFSNGGIACPGVPDTFLITILPTPVANALSNQTICAGAPSAAINFTSNQVGTVFTWTSTNQVIGIASSGTGNIAPFTAVNAGTAPISSTIVATPTLTTNGQGCAGSTVSALITVNPNPVMTSPASASFCQGSTVTYNFTNNIPNGVVYAWNNTNPSIGLGASGNGNISFQAQNGTSAPISGTVSVIPTYTSNGVSCAGASQSFNIQIIPTPTVDAVNNITLCNGTASNVVNLTSPVANATFAWTNANTAIGLGASGSGNVPIFTATNASTTTPLSSQVSVTSSVLVNGVTCTGSPTLFTITVNPSTVPTAVNGQTLCNGSNSAAIALSGTGNSYNWTNSNTAVGLAASGSGNIASFIATNGTAAPISSTVTVTSVFSGGGVSCNGGTTSFVINVNPTPSVTAPANVVLCNNATASAISFVGTGTQYNWTNSTPGIGLAASGSGNIPSFTAVNLTATPIVATINVTPIYLNNAVSCPGTVQTFTITVNPAPQVNFSVPSQTICSSTSSAQVTISSPTPNAVITWTATSVPASISGVNTASGGSTIPSFTLINNSAVVQVVQFSANAATGGALACPGGGVSYTITVNPSPNVAVPSNQVLCANTSTNAVTFSGNANVYNWSNNTTSIGLGASGQGNILAFNALNNTSNPVTATVTVTPQFLNNNVGCNGIPVTFTYTVNPIPVTNPIANQTICNGTNSSLVTPGGTATSYAWTNNNQNTGLAASGSNTIPVFQGTNAGAAPITSVITLTPTYSNLNVSCAGSTSTFNITVNPTPTVTALANQVVCNNTSTAASIFTGTGTSYTWTNSNNAIGLAASGTGTIAAFNAVNASNSIPSVATVTVTPVFTNNSVSCQGIPTSFTYTINPTPVVTAPANQVICNGASSTQVTFNGTGTQYNWTNTLTSIGLAASGSGNINAFTVSNGTINPVVSQVSVVPVFSGNNLSCAGTPQTFSITVNPSPSAVLPANQIICNGQATAAINFTGTATSYSWTNDLTSIGLAASGNGNIGSFNAVNNTNAPVTATLVVQPIFTGANLNCPGVSQTFTITVNPTPTMGVLTNQVLCNGTSSAAINFTGTATSYAWTNNTPTIGLAASGTGNIGAFSVVNASNSAAVTATLSVTPQFANGGLTCSGAVQQVTIIVNPTPIITPNPDLTYCNGASTPVISFAGTGNSYAWVNNQTSIGLAASGTGNIASFNASNPSTLPVVATVDVTPVFTANGISCNGTVDQFTITVNPTPTLAALANQVVCNGSPTTAVSFTGTVAGTVFNWTNNATSIGLAASGSGNIASFNAVNNGNNPIVAQVNVTPSFALNGVSCSGTAQSFTIMVNPTPAVNFSLANQTICSQGASNTVNITSPTNGAVITWSATTIPASITGLNPTTGNATIPTLTLTNNSSVPQIIQILASATTPGNVACPGGGTPYTITVNPTPAVTAPANQVVCHNTNTSAVSFSGTGTSYTWTNNQTAVGLAASGTGSIVAFNALNPSNSVISTATVSVTPQFTNNNVTCPGPVQTFTITVNPIPVVTPMANATFCNGTNTSLITINGTGTSYAWTNSTTSIGLGASGSGNIAPFAASNAGSTPVNATIGIIPSFTNAGVTCAGLNSNATITINPTPTVNNVNSQVICNNTNTAAITFSGTGNSYTWANNTPSIGLANSGTGNIASFIGLNASNAAASIATLTVTPQYLNNGVNCSGNTTNFTITVNPTPSANVPSSQTLCNGATTAQVNFSGTGTSYNWTNSIATIGIPASGSGNITPFVAVNNGLNPITAQLAVTPIFTGNGVSCSGTAQNFSITINPTPVVQVPANQVICNGNLSNAVNFSGNGTSYAWTNSNPSVGLAASGTGNISSFTTTNATTNPVTSTITVSPSFAGGNASCPGLPQSFTITVNPTPAVDPINSQVLCSGTPTQAIALTGTGTSYAWANNTVGIGLAASGSGNIASFNATNASSSNPLVGTITVTPQYANAGVSCSGNTQQFTITVNPTPVVNPLSNVTVCNGSNTPVVSFAGTGTSYNWSNNNNTIGLVPSGTGLSLASFQAINQSTQSVNALITVTPNFTANGVTCPGNNTTFTIFVSPTPDVVAPANQVVCNGLPTTAVTFNGSVANTTYNWTNSIPSIGILGTGTGNIAAFNAVNNGNAPIFAQVTVTPTFIQNAVSCPGSPQSYTYQINPTPSVTNPGAQYVCAGANTQLLNFTGTGTSYQWAAANTAIGIGANGTNSIPAFIGQNATNAVVSSQVTVTPIFTQGISCSGSNQTFTYYVLPIPSVAPINNQSYCHQTAVNATAINGTGTSYNWTNSNTAIGLVASGSNTVNAFNATNAGTSAISGNVNITPIFTFQGQSCNGPVGTYSITVNPTPYVNALNDTVICNNQNAAVNITTNIPANITWFATQNANVSGELTTVQTNTFINDLLSNTSSVPQNVTYTITPTTLAGCVGPDSFVVVQVQPDVLLNIPQNLEICSGAGVNAILAANIPSNFSWFCTVNNPNVTGESLITNSGAVINDILINNSNQNQLVVYSVTPTSIQGNCQGPSQTITVIVKPPLALLNQDTVTICSNGNVNLNLVANTNVTFNWYADPNVNVLNETTNITTSSIINDQLVNPTGAVEEVTYHVIGTSIANGCSSPVIPITVFVNPIPLLNPNPDLNVCHNQWNPQVLFTGSALGTVYTWNASGANVGLPILGGVDSLNAFVASNPGVAPISATILVSPLFTANNVSCAGAKDTFQIVVNPEPSVFALNNMTLCEGINSPIVPLLGPIGGTTFNWVNSNAAVGLASTGTGNVPVFMAQNPTALPIQSVVTVTPVFINGATQCSGLNQTYTITVNPTPNVLTQQVSICAGQAVNMNLLADIPSAFQWYATPNPNVQGETYSPTQTSSVINDVLIQTTNAPQSVQYHVSGVSIPYGCLGPDSIMTVTINPWPTVAFNALNPPYCDLTPIAFQNMSVGAYDYNWDFNDGSNAFVSNPTHQFPSVGTYNVVLTATDPNTGCIDSVMQPVTIAPTPNPDFSYSDSIGCGMLNVVYTAAVYNTSWNYVWNFGNGASTQQVGQVGYQFTQQGCYDISLTVTNPQGCTATETNFNVACVYESPVAVAGADPTEVTTLEPLVEFTNNSENASSYAWNFGDGTYGFGFEPIHLFPAEPADYVVSLVAMNEVGCTDTAYVSIHVEENLIYYVPNSFTPNDDEKNQVFLPIISQGFKPGTYLLRIFNRWGELVFESKDPYTGWGGDYGPNHTNCQSGTYTWVLNFQVLQSQEDKEFVGHVNLIK